MTAVEDAVPAAERRQLSVLFCDLVGSTDLSTSMDPEDWREVVRAYQSAGEKVVARYGGNIAQYLGDGLLVYFGYPQAHEDDPQRAVRAGLGILRAIRSLNPDLEQAHGISIDVRIGIDTGLVVAGEVGGEERKENLALGETPNLAARLQGIASPGTIAISSATMDLVRGYFVVRDLGAQALKGMPQPESAFEVLQEESAQSRIDVATSVGSLTPLAGRETEIERLSDLWRMASEGHGQVVTLSGDAGIGKSRLVHELRNRVSSGENAAVATCLASPYYQETAFFPLIHYIERSVIASSAGEEAETLDDRLGRLEGWLVQFGFSLAETMPLFCSLLSLPDHPDYPPVIQDPERQKQQLMDSLLRILLSREAAPTLLMVFEDLHWADATTLELLELLLPLTADVRIMLVLTFRPEFLPPWRARENITTMNLRRLDRVAAAQVANWIAGETQLPPEVLDRVLQRTDGNPLFLEELSKTVIEAGGLSDGGNRRDPDALSIPATLHDSLMARLDLLNAVKRIAQVGATIGREFSYELLQAVMQLPEREMQQGLQKLVDGEFLFQRGIPPRSEYIFKHALIQEAAYQAVLKSTRQQDHRRIAEVLVGQFPELAEKQPELIARHYTEAGMADRAIPCWQAAGAQALASAANVEAIAHLDRALKLLHTMPEDESTVRQELELQTLLAPAYMAIKGWASEEVELASRRAHELAVSLGDFEASFASLWGVCMNDFLRGRLNEALVTGTQVYELGGDHDLAMFDIMSRHAVGYVHFYRGDFQEALALSQRALERFEMEIEQAIVLGFQFASSSALRIMNGCSLWMLGFPERAPDLVGSAVELTRDLNHFPSEAFALGASLLFHHYRLDIESTELAVEQLLDLAERESFEIWSPFAHMFRGWVMSERGDHLEGIAETRMGIEQWRGTGSYLNDTITTAMLVRMLWKAQHLEEALSTADEAIAACDERRELQFAPELHRIKGEVLLELGKEADAERCIEDALTLARDQEAKMLELRAATTLARLMGATGRRDQALAMLEPLYDWFTEGQDEHDLRDARTLLAELRDRM